jgi:DNA-binding response OmpR family regulator
VSVVLNSTVDLLVTDLGPPQMTGPAVARALAASKPALRVLFLSDTEAPKDGFGLQPGAPEPTLLRKPFNATELGRAVREVLDRASPR